MNRTRDIFSQAKAIYNNCADDYQKQYIWIKFYMLCQEMNVIRTSL